MSKNIQKRKSAAEPQKTAMAEALEQATGTQPTAGNDDAEETTTPRDGEAPVSNEKLSPLAREYVARAVESLTRTPSPNLKSADFRATLLHWRAVAIQCLGATKSPAQALVVAIQAIASNEGTLQAKRLVDNVMGQALWNASVDIDRAEYRENRTAGDVEQAMRERIGAFADEELRHDSTTHPAGLDPERDPDYVEPPTMEEAIEALVEVNAWLGMLADLLPADDTERLFLQLEGGLAYTQRKTTSDITGEDMYEPVTDVDEAVEIQRQKNKASFAARTARRMEAQKGTFAAIAKLAA